MTPSGKDAGRSRGHWRSLLVVLGQDARPHPTPSPPVRPERRASARRVVTSRPYRPGCASWPGARA